MMELFGANILRHCQKASHMSGTLLFLHSSFHVLYQIFVSNFSVWRKVQTGAFESRNFDHKSNMEYAMTPPQKWWKSLPHLSFSDSFPSLCLHLCCPQDCVYNEGHHFCLYLQFTSFLHPDIGATRLLVRRAKGLETLSGSKKEASLGVLEELPVEKKVADVVAAGWKFPGNFVSLLLLI